MHTTSTAKWLTCVPRVQKLCSSNPGPANSYTALQKRHCFNIMQVAVLPWCYDMEMDTANLLHALTLYGGTQWIKFGRTWI